MRYVRAKDLATVEARRGDDDCSRTSTMDLITGKAVEHTMATPAGAHLKS